MCKDWTIVSTMQSKKKLQSLNARLITKTKAPHTWNELIIQNGDLQLLVIGGNGISNNREIKYYLGTSLKYTSNGR